MLVATAANTYGSIAPGTVSFCWTSNGAVYWRTGRH